MGKRNIRSARAPSSILLTGLFLAGLSLVKCSAPSIAPRSGGGDDVRLVLWITIDQLRADFFERWEGRYAGRGFRYLQNNGVWYREARFRHSTTLTAVGHASLFTGGNAAHHGIAGNDWLHPETREHIYAVADDRHPIIGKAAGTDAGISPRNLTAPTIGDDLVQGSEGASRVFSVSVKDRGAVIPGGKEGKAFWYDKSSGDFITSTYYYDSCPDWVTSWNESHPAERYRGRRWELLNPESTYFYKRQDDRPQEKGYKRLGTTFPHPLDHENPEDFFSALRYTPMADELTLDFALELLERESLGRGVSPDMLAVSFSSLDYIGHAFGPNSMEYEDNVLRADLLVEKLLDFVDEAIGLNRVLVVLASDHGVDAIPEYMQSLGLRAGRIYPERMIVELNESLGDRFDMDDPLITAFWNPGLYLNRAAIEKRGIDVEAVENALAEEIVKQPGIARALTRSALLRGDVPDGEIEKKVAAAFHPERSGDVLLVQEMFWYLYHDPNIYAAMHGSPYRWDTQVPVLLAGPGIIPARIKRLVHPEDIARTVAVYLGIDAAGKIPGEPLSEVVPAGDGRD